MNTQEIMQKVRRIEMRARKLATATFAGQYRSGFRGQGLDFDDFREYMPGDEPRFIDWKVTARTGVPYVRRFHEEREQVLLLCVDVSASMNYAGAGQADTKREYAALLAAVLAYSAARNGDKVGLLLFGCRPNRYLRPDKGMRQCLRIINEILTAPTDGPDDTAEAVSDAVLRSQRKPAMVFLVSDFLMPPDKHASSMPASPAGTGYKPSSRRNYAAGSSSVPSSAASFAARCASRAARASARRCRALSRAASLARFFRRARATSSARLYLRLYSRITRSTGSSAIRAKTSSRRATAAARLPSSPP